MLLEALKTGLTEERIAAALNVSLESIRTKRDMLNGICPEAVQSRSKVYSAHQATGSRGTPPPGGTPRAQPVLPRIPGCCNHCILFDGDASHAAPVARPGPSSPARENVTPPKIHRRPDSEVWFNLGPKTPSPALRGGYI
jgi:hypothetical protein